MTLATVIDEGAASAAPGVVEELEVHELPLAFELELWTTARSCRCERPMAIREAATWSWLRCVKCGRDIDGAKR